MSPLPVLRASPEYPESQRPGYVQALVRPPAYCRASQLAFLMFEKTDLVKAERFWLDFGLITVSRTTDRLVMRAAGAAPAVLVATKARRSRYVGAAFVVGDEDDLGKVLTGSEARQLSSDAIPGGGQGVSLRDPDGNLVWLIKRWGCVDPMPMPQPLTDQMNTLTRVRRVNATIRPPIEPARVGRIGHVVLQTTDFARMADWYMRHLGLVPTDVQYLPDGSPMLTFFRLDLGSLPADHHTVVIAGGIENRYEHSAWEVADLDALGQGQQVLKANGHQHMWGIGRHLLGSQLFDYWYDGDGLEFEHYTDGDMFTADHETRYVPFSTGSIWAWGADVPASMLPKKSVGVLLKVLRLVFGGRLPWRRLRMIGGVVNRPPRPWL